MLSEVIKRILDCLLPPSLIALIERALSFVPSHLSCFYYHSHSLQLFPHTSCPTPRSLYHHTSFCPYTTLNQYSSLLQPSQSDPVTGLMLWKITVNRYFYCHLHLPPAALVAWQLPRQLPSKREGKLSCVLCCDRSLSLISIISQFVLSFYC